MKEHPAVYGRKIKEVLINLKTSSSQKFKIKNMNTTAQLSILNNRTRIIKTSRNQKVGRRNSSSKWLSVN